MQSYVAGNGADSACGADDAEASTEELAAEMTRAGVGGSTNGYAERGEGRQTVMLVEGSGGKRPSEA